MWCLRGKKLVFETDLFYLRPSKSQPEHTPLWLWGRIISWESFPLCWWLSVAFLGVSGVMVLANTVYLTHIHWCLQFCSRCSATRTKPFCFLCPALHLTLHCCVKETSEIKGGTPRQNSTGPKESLPWCICHWKSSQSGR